MTDLASWKDLLTPGGLLTFILYKEIPLWIRKRNGKFISYEDMKEAVEKIQNTLTLTKEDLNKHQELDAKIQGEISMKLEVQKAVQEQVNINIQKDLGSINGKLDNLNDMILSIIKK